MRRTLSVDLARPSNSKPSAWLHSAAAAGPRGSGHSANTADVAVAPPASSNSPAQTSPQQPQPQPERGLSRPRRSLRRALSLDRARKGAAPPTASTIAAWSAQRRAAAAAGEGEGRGQATPQPRRGLRRALSLERYMPRGLSRASTSEGSKLRSGLRRTLSLDRSRPPLRSAGAMLGHEISTAAQAMSPTLPATDASSTTAEPVSATAAMAAWSQVQQVMQQAQQAQREQELMAELRQARQAQREAELTAKDYQW